MKKIISTFNAPDAIGPYSQAVLAGDYMFLSGQLPTDPRTGAFAAEDVKGQTEQVIKNITAVLESRGLSLDCVVKTTVFLKDINDFEDMNSVYGSHFKTDCPARTTVQAAALPKGAKVEIEVVAYAKGDAGSPGSRI